MKKIFNAGIVSFSIMALSMLFSVSAVYAQPNSMIQPPVSNINPHPVYDYSAYTGAAPTASSYVNPNAGIGACSNLVSGLSSVASCTLGILNAIIPIIVALTVVWIIWGAFGLTKSEGEDRKKWRDVILYGIVGLFVMVSIYGLVHILTGTFGLTGGGLPPVHINFQ